MVQLRALAGPGMGRGPADGLGRPLAKDDLPAIHISRLRASGAVRPDMASVALIVGGLERTIGLAHLQFPNGGGWSLFICPQCQGRRRVLRLAEDGRLACWRCDGLAYACKRRDRAPRIAALRALLYGGPARLKPRWLDIDRRRRLEAALRRLIIRDRLERLERIERLRGK
jgi:hypothetical protein